MKTTEKEVEKAKDLRFSLSTSATEYLKYFTDTICQGLLPPESIYRLFLSVGLTEMPKDYKQNLGKQKGERKNIRLVIFQHPIFDSIICERFGLTNFSDVLKQEYYQNAMEYGAALLKERVNDSSFIWNYLSFYSPSENEEVPRHIDPEQISPIYLELGTDDSGDPVTIHFNHESTSQHMAVCGKANSGKTQFGLELSSQIKEQSRDTSIIFVDLVKGDVASNKAFLDLIGGKSINVKKEGLPFNPFQLPCRDEEEIKALAGLFLSQQPKVGPKQSVGLFRLLSGAMDRHKHLDMDTFFQEMEQHYEEENKDYDTLYELFHTLNISGMFPKHGEVKGNTLYNQSFVLNMKEVIGAGREKELYVFFFLYHLYKEVTLLPDDAPIDPLTGSRHIRTVVLMDEAHAYLGTKYPLIDKMVRELRAKGVALVFITQGFGDLDREFQISSQLSQIFLLKSDNSQKSVEKALAISRQIAEPLSTQISHCPFGYVYSRKIRDKDPHYSQFNGKMFFNRNFKSE